VVLLPLCTLDSPLCLGPAIVVPALTGNPAEQEKHSYLKHDYDGLRPLAKGKDSKISLSRTAESFSPITAESMGHRESLRTTAGESMGRNESGTAFTTSGCPRKETDDKQTDSKRLSLYCWVEGVDL
jgi:hypothetical protein